MFKTISAIIATIVAISAQAKNAEPGDFLIKLKDSAGQAQMISLYADKAGFKIQKIGLDRWVHLQVDLAKNSDITMDRLAGLPSVEYVQPNYKIRLDSDYKLDGKAREQLFSQLAGAGLLRTSADPGDIGDIGDILKGGGGSMPADNPEIPMTKLGGSGSDPESSKQWGMNDNRVQSAWSGTPRGRGVVVAVIDTGIDYTHEDLVDNLWRNPGEMGRDAQGRDKATNGVDDDGNGYIDDVIGWDFATNDNKPFDLAVDPIQLLMGGGNPGHGTHCAGNVAASAENGKGVVGVAPNAQIMGLRFLTEKGEGTTEGAVNAINYAVKMGAKVLSNSWGSEGEDPADPSNRALKEAIQNAQTAGVLFIAAAGNGHNGVGYDNDSDPKPAYPASYAYDNIISVAALDSSDQMGKFSNWGARSVDIGAPGVVIFSTTVGGKYSDTVIDMFGIKATWDGTSMATPHVAGAAALYWSANPSATWREVKEAILRSAKPVNSMSGKSVSGGKLDVFNLMRK